MTSHLGHSLQGSGYWLYGAAPESNRPSRGLHDRTSFEDPLGHRAHAAPSRTLDSRGPGYARLVTRSPGDAR